MNKRISSKQKAARQRNFNVFRLRGIKATIGNIKVLQSTESLFNSLNRIEVLIQDILNKEIKNLK